MTGRSQNFRLAEIAKRETTKDPSKLGDEQPRAYPEHRRWSVTSTSLAYGLPIMTLPKGIMFPCATQIKDLYRGQRWLAWYVHSKLATISQNRYRVKDPKITATSWSAILQQASCPQLLGYQVEKERFSRSWNRTERGSSPARVKSQSNSISRQTSCVLSRAGWHEPLNHLLIAKSTQAAGGTSQP